MSGPLRILICCLLFAGSGGLAADQIWLRNGGKLEGSILHQSRFQVRIRTADGTKSIAKSSIRKITFGPAAAPPRAPEAARAAPTASKAAPATSVGTSSLEALLQKQAQEAARKKAEEERKRRAAERRARIERERRAREARRRKQEAADSLARSLKFPGWGQWSIQKREGVGYAFGGAFAFSLGQVVLLELEAASLAAQFDARERQLLLFLAASPGGHGGAVDYVLSNQVHETSLAFQQARTSQLHFLLLAGALYAANIGDVILARPAGPQSALRLGPGRTPGADGLRLALELRF